MAHIYIPITPLPKSEPNYPSRIDSAQSQININNSSNSQERKTQWYKNGCLIGKTFLFVVIALWVILILTFAFLFLNSR